jgi:phosphoserine aminotransferase
MSRSTFNFGAGPGALPEPVLERVRDQFLDLDRGMSILEISHRSEAFAAIAARAEADLRRLLGIPDEYHVLFLQGGATLQFSAVPLNLASPEDRADHIVTGAWSKKAAVEAARHCKVTIAADGSESGYRTVPPPAVWDLDPAAAYVAYAGNETIHGIELHAIPDSGSVPLVADMSSTILSRPIDVSRFGAIYFGAQKNLGPAGLTVVIVRGDLLDRARPGIPALLDWSQMARSGSLLNTPPTFAWYVAGLVLSWIDSEGGLAAMEVRSRSKKQRLYDAIDQSSLYRNDVDPAYRSWTNVPFRLTAPELEPRFLSEAESVGLLNLKGHRDVGGIRASLYNAMPEAGVDALIDFMDAFERRAPGSGSAE